MTQSAFATALLDPDAAVPPGITDPQGAASPRRFAVYRNNVAASLTRALEAGFPTVRKLVGDEFFGAMAALFLRAHPPMTPRLMHYGAALPDWLERFSPVAHLGYLADVARLDQALRESYHAADSTPLTEAAFARLLAGDIAGVRLQLAPSLRLLRSRWPVQAIWAANHRNGPRPDPVAQDVLILRPEFDPVPRLLPPGGAAVIASLLAGATLGDSIAGADEGQDLAVLLQHLVAGRAIIGVSE